MLKRFKEKGKNILFENVYYLRIGNFRHKKREHLLSFSLYFKFC